MNAPYAGYPQPQPQQPYPPSQQVAWQQPAPPRRAGGASRWLPGLLAALGFLVAAGAVVWGSFQTIQSLEQKFGANSTFKYTMTWWRLDQTINGRATRPPYPPFGVLLEVAAGLLVLAAVLGLAAFANRRAGLVTGTRLSGALGVGLLAGVVGTRLMDAQQVSQQVNNESIGEGDSVSFSTGLGLWLPASAIALALLATIAMLLRARPAAARLEPATPPMGVRLPYGAAPGQQQYQAQPHTGPQPVPQQQPVYQQQQSGYQQQPGYQQPSAYQQPAGTPPHGSAAAVPSAVSAPYEQPAPTPTHTTAPAAETPAEPPAEPPPARAEPQPEPAPQGDEGDAARN